MPQICKRTKNMVAGSLLMSFSITMQVDQSSITQPKVKINAFWGQKSELEIYVFCRVKLLLIRGSQLGFLTMLSRNGLFKKMFFLRKMKEMYLSFISHLCFL